EPASVHRHGTRKLREQRRDLVCSTTPRLAGWAHGFGSTRRWCACAERSALRAAAGGCTDPGIASLSAELVVHDVHPRHSCRKRSRGLRQAAIVYPARVKFSSPGAAKLSALGWGDCGGRGKPHPAIVFGGLSRSWYSGTRL